MKNSRTKRITVTVVITVAVCALTVLASQYLFLNGNIFRSAYGLVRVLTSDKDFTQIGDNPTIYVLDNDKSADEFLTENGYTQEDDKRLGSKYFVTNDGQEYSALFFDRGFYSVIRIESADTETT